MSIPDSPAPPSAPQPALPPGTAPAPSLAPPSRRALGKRLAAVVLGLAAAVTAMLTAFALPAIHSGPHRIPVGVTGPPAVTQPLQRTLDGGAWRVTAYPDENVLKAAVHDRKVAGGLAFPAGQVHVYTATAGGQQATAAITALAGTLAARQGTGTTVTDLAPFPARDPRGAGFGTATLPLIFGGLFPALVLVRLFPSRFGLGLRLAGAAAFSLVAGAGVAALLQFGTGTLDGSYLRNAAGLALGMAALSIALLGLHAAAGTPALGAGVVVVFVLGNPLSALATGPHWLPDGWAAVGQLLPPGAAGTLLRANAYFGGHGAGTAAATLGVWVAAGLALALVAGRPRRAPGADPAAVRAVAGHRPA
ncbi:hypothetical protein KNE206_32620 [Kitasatospora sp. NE20-6]|uniref:hypothetical protein n=1 Tax=Kitasatospora sp. NE20-6 TaxID=2859066 RepID=UPI0034DBB779